MYHIASFTSLRTVSRLCVCVREDDEDDDNDDDNDDDEEEDH